MVVNDLLSSYLKSRLYKIWDKDKYSIEMQLPLSPSRYIEYIWQQKPADRSSNPIDSVEDYIYIYIYTYIYIYKRERERETSVILWG